MLKYPCGSGERENTSPGIGNMEATSSVTNTQQNQPSTAETPKTEKAAGSFDSSQFETFLKAKMGGNSASKVSEEALFSTLVQARVSAKSTESASAWSAAIQKQESALTKGDGFIPLESAAKAALQELQTAGTLTAEEADKIYSDCFAAAQLDGNASALYDDRGGGADVTVAVAAFADALKGASEKMGKIDSGELVVDARNVGEVAAGAGSGVSEALKLIGSGSTVSGDGSVFTPDGTTFDGSKGFLFKPISNNQGTLAVLLPEAFKGNVTGVTLKDSSGRVIEDGVSTGYGEEGISEKFSFRQEGGSYPADLTVSIQFMDGTHTDYLIPDPSKRYD